MHGTHCHCMICTVGKKIGMIRDKQQSDSDHHDDHHHDVGKHCDHSHKEDGHCDCGSK